MSDIGDEAGGNYFVNELYIAFFKESNANLLITASVRAALCFLYCNR